MSNYDFGAIILPTLEKNPFELAQCVLEVHLSMAKRWCKSKKLNVSTVFKYFTKKDVPLTRTDHSHHLNAFCLYILTRFF